MQKPSAPSISSKPAFKTRKFLWQEISEAVQDKVSGSGFDAYTKVISGSPSYSTGQSNPDRPVIAGYIPNLQIHHSEG